MAEPEANRSFATGYLLQTIAMVLHGDADLLKLAIRHYSVAAELRPDAPSIVRNLGLAYASLEQWDKAVQAYSKAMALAPDDPELLTDAAVAQQRSGRAEEAAALYQAALNTVDSAAEKERVHSKMRGTITRLKSEITVDLVGSLNSDTAK
jgi:tetratricopeptide (TPR) repeat protein